MKPFVAIDMETTQAPYAGPEPLKLQRWLFRHHDSAVVHSVMAMYGTFFRTIDGRQYPAYGVAECGRLSTFSLLVQIQRDPSLGVFAADDAAVTCIVCLCGHSYEGRLMYQAAKTRAYSSMYTSWPK